MDRRIALGVFLGLFLLTLFVPGAGGGMSSQCQNGVCYTAASTTPIGVGLGLISLAFLVAFSWTYKRSAWVEDDEPVKVWRRLVAFLLIDYVALVMTFVPFVSLAVLLQAATIEGAFSWQFQRIGDWSAVEAVGFTTLLAVMLSPPLLYWLYAIFGRATLGQHIMGYRIGAADQDEDPKFTRGTLISLIGYVVWPVSLALAIFRKDKKFWWHLFSNTKPIRVEAAKYYD